MSPSRFVNAARCRSSGALGKQGPSLRKQRPRRSFVQSSTKVSLYLRVRSIRTPPGNSFRRPASKLGLSMNNGTLSEIQVPTRNKHVLVYIHLLPDRERLWCARTARSIGKRDHAGRG